MVNYDRTCFCQYTICNCNAENTTYSTMQVTVGSAESTTTCGVWRSYEIVPPPPRYPALDLLAYRGTSGSRNAVRRHRKEIMNDRHPSPSFFAKVRTESKIFRETLRVRKQV